MSAIVSEDATAVTSNNNDETVPSTVDDVAAAPSMRGSPEGCYLVFDTTSGGRLMLFYTQGGGDVQDIPQNAVGFWCASPAKPIQSFKFKQSGGRVELIKGIAGGDQNRRKYFSGWAQFIKLAKQRVSPKSRPWCMTIFNTWISQHPQYGKVIKFTLASQSVPVDVYGYTKTSKQPMILPLDEGLVDINDIDAVAVLPRHNSQFRGIKTMDIQTFLEMGNIAGAATLLN